ncbi:MAG: hypothetical protein H6708_04420 [Kofleriaceae bacterium]|nr:hypothetical protein [Kofleriaceae bacterium]
MLALAAADGADVVATLSGLAELERAWRSAAALRLHLAWTGVTVDGRDAVDGDGDDQWARLVHRWGRGDAAPGALAAVLARRAVLDRVAAVAAGAPDATLAAAPTRWRRALRCEALLPDARAGALERAVLTRLTEGARDGRA